MTCQHDYRVTAYLTRTSYDGRGRMEWEGQLRTCAHCGHEYETLTSSNGEIQTILETERNPA